FRVRTPTSRVAVPARTIGRCTRLGYTATRSLVPRRPRIHEEDGTDDRGLPGPRAPPSLMQTAELLRKVRRIEIRSRHLVEDLFAGQSVSVFKGRGIEFEEVRPYIPGDEVRDIDWNVTARLGAPSIKRFVEERELTVLLVVDVSRSMRFGTAGPEKRELAAELA